MKILVHICCSIDSHFFLTKLREEHATAELVGYFYDPNIHPKAEYELRFADVARSCKALQIPLLLGPYDDAAWFARCSSLAHEPERGRRCDVCFDVRLARAAAAARAVGANYLATTLAASPKKDLAQLAKSARKVIAQSPADAQLFELSDDATAKYLEQFAAKNGAENGGENGGENRAENGAENSAETLAQLEFLCPDYRAHGGTQQQLQMAKSAQLYHQNYCGCVYALSAFRPDAAELYEPADRAVLPGSIAHRRAVFAQAAAMQERGEAFALQRRKVLGYQLERAAIERGGQPVRAAVLAYSHFAARRTQINAAHEGEICRSNRDEITLISAKFAAKLLGQIAREAAGALAAEARSWADNFERASESGGSGGGECAGSSAESGGGESAGSGAEIWLAQWLKGAPSLPLQMALRSKINPPSATEFSSGGFSSGGFADSGFAGGGEEFSSGGEEFLISSAGGFFGDFCAFDISPIIITAELGGKFNICASSRVFAQSIFFIERAR